MCNERDDDDVQSESDSEGEEFATHWPSAVGSSHCLLDGFEWDRPYF